MALRGLLFEGEQVANASPANVAKDSRADTDTLAGLALTKDRDLKKSKAVSIPKTIAGPAGQFPWLRLRSMVAAIWTSLALPRV
jgi:hypothetical protein